MHLNKFKGITKHQHLNSNHNTGQPKTQNAIDSFLFSLKKQLALRRQMTQIKKRKNGWPVMEKILFSQIFFTSVLTIAREMPKMKGKILTRCVSFSNKNSDIKTLYVFTGNVKPCIQLHI